MMNRSIYRQFVRYTIPTVAAMLVNGLYQVVDGIFIGHYVLKDPLINHPAHNHIGEVAV
ncbi:Na+-driven multidrug efflux pump [Vibrio cholerae]|nr:Na+-driven multidrug efflux pump [Vibrio cholerae]